MVITEEFFLSGEPVVNEIKDLHDFFEKWFNGNKNSPAIERCTEVIAEDFELITPSAQRFGQDQLIKLLTKDHGSSKNKKIWVEDIKTKVVGNTVIATYFELQKNNNQEHKRISTAVFSFKEDAPNYCQWHQVHETWVKD